ncbi:MAG TPA: DUF3788 family protein [Vicinamibacteria bacterium]|nr:DUF3788 family protein [Vicinamibacteria bacterium]
MKNTKPQKARPLDAPRDADLAKLLGRSHSAFHQLADRADGSTAEWKRYGKDSPWVLKISQAKRTLYYLQPERGGFKVTVVLGARATQAALAGQVSKRLHAGIRAARAYAEGRPVCVVVKGLADVADVEELLAAKLRPAGVR